MVHALFFRSRWKIVAACAVSLLGFLAPTGAAVTVSYLPDPSQEAYAVSSTDLINSGSPSLLSSTDVGYTPFSFDGGTSTTAALNDGLAGIAYTPGNGALSTGAFDGDGTWTTAFFLNGGYTTIRLNRLRVGRHSVRPRPTPCPCALWATPPSRR